MSAVEEDLKFSSFSDDGVTQTDVGFLPIHLPFSSASKPALGWSKEAASTLTDLDTILSWIIIPHNATFWFHHLQKFDWKYLHHFLTICTYFSFPRVHRWVHGIGLTSLNEKHKTLSLLEKGGDRCLYELFPSD